MKIVGRNKLDAFCRLHADARKPVEGWLAETEEASWTTPQQIKERYASVSFLAENRMIFNIKGNTYRLMTTIGFGAGVVVVDWVGTHSEYDAINWNRQ